MRHVLTALLAVLGFAASAQFLLGNAGAQTTPQPTPPPLSPQPSSPQHGTGETTQPRAEVDLLLVLAVDISRSVDERKFKLQRDGYAAALTNPRVVQAMRSGVSGRIAISFLEWSGVDEQAIVADWTLIGSRDEAEALAHRIQTAPRPFLGRTAIGSAIEFALLQFPRSPYRSTRRMIDVSGDGTNNSGVDVEDARDMAVAQGITVNGLAILSDAPLPFNPMHTHPPGGLLNYYQMHVIGGPNSFAFVAESHESFGTAILAKLIKEIALGETHGRIE